MTDIIHKNEGHENAGALTHPAFFVSILALKTFQHSCYMTLWHCMTSRGVFCHDRENVQRLTHPKLRKPGDLDCRPTTLTFKVIRDTIKVNVSTKFWVCTSNGSAVRAFKETKAGPIPYSIIEMKVKVLIKYLKSSWPNKLHSFIFTMLSIFTGLYKWNWDWSTVEQGYPLKDTKTFKKVMAVHMFLETHISYILSTRWKIRFILKRPQFIFQIFLFPFWAWLILGP